MVNQKLTELQEQFEKTKKSGIEGWLQLEVLLFIAEQLQQLNSKNEDL